MLNNHFNHIASALSAQILYLSRHPLEQRRLQKELVGAFGNQFAVKASQEGAVTGSPDLSIKLASLPYLDAVIHESLRLRMTPPTPNPRMTSKDATTIGPYVNIPAGTRIQTYPWILHRNEKFFPDAEAWDPERWLVSTNASDNNKLDNRTKRVRQGPRDGFWAFGSGARGCPGRSMSLECK